MSNKIAIGIIASFQIAVLFVVILLVYNSLLGSPLAENPQSEKVLEKGKEATKTAFDFWIIIDTIGFILVLGGIIFGIIYAVIKIIERENPTGL